MPSLRVIVDGEGAWPDLAKHPKKVMWLADTALSIAALPHGMQSGRASVCFRVDLPDGRTVCVETSLRTLHAAVTAIVTKHGEDFMKSPLSERERKLALGMADLVRQLQDCKQRLGEAMELNFETGDATWDRESQLREALALAKSMVLSGEAMSDEAARKIDAALAGMKL